MLVYGDAVETANPRERIETLREALDHLPRLPAGIVRHGGLVSALIEAGVLAQGVADAAFAERGWDAPSPAQDAVLVLLVALSRAVRASWESGFGTKGAVPRAALDQLAALALPERIEIKRPEGYVFYALYPEAYLQAAKALEHAGPVRVIGIRSIGTGLAAMVAAALDAPAPVTVRPIGHPFERRLALAPALIASLRDDETATFAIVDEGPGLSGSSFGAVADTLEENGVAPHRIVFCPSHANDLGPEAGARHRRRWRQARKAVADFDSLVLHAAEPAHRLETWVADLTGPAAAPLEDGSAGAWRRLRYSSEADWPPAFPGQERRKFLLCSASGRWLLKFIGLGPDAQAKLSLARRLHEAGFAPEPAGVRHGFLVERWIEARPLDLRSVDRTMLVDTVARYLAWRALHAPAEPWEGASSATLLEMARHNIGAALGADAAQPLDRFAERLPDLDARARRIRTDNRLHAWEWLELPDGRLLKADALDHHAAHDLVGSQDVAWDIAGASVELGLSPEEAARLRFLVEQRTGRAVEPDLLAFALPCYLAFQLGHFTMAADATAWDEAEARRLRAAAEGYARRLKAWAASATS